MVWTLSQIIIILLSLLFSTFSLVVSIDTRSKLIEYQNLQININNQQIEFSNKQLKVNGLLLPKEKAKGKVKKDLYPPPKKGQLDKIN